VKNYWSHYTFNKSSKKQKPRKGGKSKERRRKRKRRDVTGRGGRTRRR
jgi:hypothetical protein